QDRMLVGRTNVMCGIPAERDASVGVLLVNGSGHTEYSESAEVAIRVVSPNGSEVQATGTIPAFAHRLFWLDDLIPDWREYLAEGFGTVIVQSVDADLHSSLVTIRNARAVTMQHMWGY